jgi:hypothetical protein
MGRKPSHGSHLVADGDKDPGNETTADAGQVRLAGEAWPPGATMRVRTGLHTREAHVQQGDYVDHAPINRCARVKAAARRAGTAHQDEA